MGKTITPGHPGYKDWNGFSTRGEAIRQERERLKQELSTGKPKIAPAVLIALMAIGAYIFTQSQ